MDPAAVVFAMTTLRFPSLREGGTQMLLKYQRKLDKELRFPSLREGGTQRAAP